MIKYNQLLRNLYFSSFWVSVINNTMTILIMTILIMTLLIMTLLIMNLLIMTLLIMALLITLNTGDITYNDIT